MHYTFAPEHYQAEFGGRHRRKVAARLQAQLDADQDAAYLNSQSITGQTAPTNDYYNATHDNNSIVDSPIDANPQMGDGKTAGDIIGIIKNILQSKGSEQQSMSLATVPDPLPPNNNKQTTYYIIGGVVVLLIIMMMMNKK